MDDENRKSDTQAALDAGRASAQIMTPESEQDIIVIPSGCTAYAVEKLIEPFLAAPRRIKASPAFQTVASFIAYVAKYSTEKSAIFAQSRPGTQPSFTAIIDYHGDSGDNDADPEWCQHRATYQTEFTPEWKRWFAADKKHMDQETFVSFLEDNIDLIVEPEAAELLEMASNLEGKNNLICRSLVNLGNGKKQLLYEENVSLQGSGREGTTPGKMEFPTTLVAGIIPFIGGEVTFKVKARLKYRIGSNKLDFWYETIDAHLIIDECVAALRTKIEEETEIVPYEGAAPS